MIPSKRTASPAVITEIRSRRRVAGKPSCREPRARLIHHDGENDRAPDHDPLVVLVEVERTDRLSNQMMSNAPSVAPKALPRPPIRLAPPTTADAIA